MVNYEQGKIYKITCEKTGNIYIGSTTKKLICQRLAEHVNQYKYYVNGKNVTYISSFEIIKENLYTISLLENYPCQSRNELTARENHHIRTIKCVNVYGKNMYINGGKDENIKREVKESLAKKLLEEKELYWTKKREYETQEQKRLIKQKREEPYFIECSKFRKINIY